MKIKICGLQKKEQLDACIENGADFCGFIINYPKSHRYVHVEKLKNLIEFDRKNSKYVGVLVKPTKEELEKFSELNLDYFQIYGEYTDEDIFFIKKKYGKKIITTIQVKNYDDVFKYKKIKKNSDIILWDSSGLEKSLNWNFNWIKTVSKDVEKMIAGNIKINDLKKLSNLADIVDVSGSLETNRVKDVNKIINFLNEIKNINEKN
jgi:phosphoribosylanthranilate isomerase